jgi:hypothetical protein
MVAENISCSRRDITVLKLVTTWETIMHIQIVMVIFPGGLLSRGFFQGLEFALANVVQESPCPLGTTILSSRGAPCGMSS